MEALKVIRTPAISLLIPNINTDVIMPSREMRKVERTGLKEGIFADWRYLPGSRDPDPNFIMN
ncbi:MAG: 3-isopropylmalate dehydratase small subunit, partial [Pseudomonadota bacterium]|nr:3-isopropylmalate dehydratase small subunit [Pseudomonadota bacterium]